MDTKRLELFSFEARYESAFSLWDNAGVIASEISKKYKTELETAEPNKLKFIYKETMEFRVELKSVAVVWYPKELKEKDFIEACELLVSLAQTILGVTEYERLGARKHLFEKQKDIDTAVKAFHDRSYTRKKSGDFFGINGQSQYEESVVRWEDEDIGTLVRVQTQKKEIKFTPPINLYHYFESSEKEEAGILFDVDYYTKKVVKAAQLDVGVWLKQASELINEDTEKLLSI